jgi:tetratricopeptide (TPR) repeat protein
MSTIDPVVPGGTLLHFQLIERLGTAVWRAEDTRNGKLVAVKILTRQLPKDPSRREQLIKEIRQAAALYHTFLIPIIEIAVATDMLLMVMELVEGTSLSKHLAGQPLDRAGFFRLGYQIADALKFLHAKNVVHQNISGDTILVTPSGQVKVGGFNVTNLMPRKDGASMVYQQRSSDPHAVAYLAPEQISTKTADTLSDIFSLGVVMFEMSTGKLPYSAATGPDVARLIVEGQPASPKVLNPNIDPMVLSIMGRCLFKDPFKRHKDVKAITEEMAKADPAAAQFATELASRITPAASATAPGQTRRALLLLADCPDPLDSSKMQQIVGEAAFLFDGQIADPFAPRVIAEMPTVDNALEAARKCEFDLSSETIQVRLLLHAGEVSTRDGEVVGETITSGFAAVAELPSKKLHISEAFAARAKSAVRLRDAGARGGLKLFTIVPPEPTAQPTPSTAEVEAQIAEEEAEIAVATAALKKDRQRKLAVAATVAVVVLGGAGFMMRNKFRHAETVAASAPSAPSVPTAAHPAAVLLQPFAVEGADPTLAQRANAIRLASIEVLKSFPELRVVESPGVGVSAFGATLRAGQTGLEIVPNAGSTKGQSAALADAAAGVRSIVQWVAEQVHAKPQNVPSSDALNAFADAVAATETAKTDTALRATIKADPTFLPAQMMAMHFFAANGKVADSLAAAKQIETLAPHNLEAHRVVARAGLVAGKLREAFTAYANILKSDPNDAESLNVLGRYAWGAGDQPHFTAVLGRARGVPPALVAVHEPDMLLAAGRIEAAIEKYYDIEVNVPNNPALSLKIGRISVLRHSLPIAELELKKLEGSDPEYGAHLLKAYLAAHQNDRPGAENELKSALNASRPGDDYWTSAAEVRAMFADANAAVAALEKASERKEPTVAYILVNPLFRYLDSDARFQAVKAKLTADQSEMRDALAGVM